MKKLFVLTASILLAACGNDNSTSATDTEKTSSNDFGEGYTYAMAHRYDETTGIMYQRIEACYYHRISKTFTWEEAATALDSNKLTIVGDSMWIGPVEKFISENPNEQSSYDAYENRETLLLSNDHNGIYGKWTMTGCKRTFGETEFKCSSSIGGMRGIARTLNITKDSIYNTTVVDLSNITSKNNLNFSSILYNRLGFDIGDLYIDTLAQTQVIKAISDTAFSIGSQIFKIGNSAKFDKTGMNFYETISSNGKTCTRHEQLGIITKEQCLEGNADFLLSDRGDEDDSYHYEEGPVEGFSTDNREEFNECTKGLVTEETKNLLNPYSRNHN